MDENFTDLVLIMGMNPLPNYVAADYFLETNKNLKRIWMFCSEKNEYQKSTEEFGKNLRVLIEKKHNFNGFMEFSFISDINKKSNIEKEADKMLKKIRDKNVKLAHLFYTGGTKSEVVHIYNYFRNNTQNINFTFSYLSARDFRIYIDDSEKKSKDLREIVKLGFADLCALHSFRLEGNNTDDIFPEITEKFSELIQNGEIKNFFSTNGGYNRKLFFDKKNNLADKISKITKTNLEKLERFKPNETFQKICDAFPKSYNPFPNGNFNNKLSNKHFKHVFKGYLDGKWLEAYCKKVIENSNLKYDEILVNQEPSKENLQNNFELDIILMKGYQLVGISCTTSKEKYLCKTKGFEIILRTRQIGGAEAKAILITGTDEINSEILQNELIISTGTTKENILVLGFEDWKKEILIEKITNFLEWR